MAELKEIQVRGAREHNLKSIDVDIPKNKLVVVTGLSGSGKSSLAIDTIYAEGQRRYVESLSAYARQFLNIMDKPDLDYIAGLSPAISIEQKTTSNNPRSTVGTITEIYDYLRLLFARVGVPHSPATGKPITAQQVSDMVDRIMSLEEGTRLYLLSPIVRDRKGEYRKELLNFQKKGFIRVRIDGEFQELDDLPKLSKNIRHDIDLVVDRLIVRPGIEERLADSIRTALDHADGIAMADAQLADGSVESITFSEKFACPVSGFTVPELEPRLFSFNAPFGACPVCDGLGSEAYFDENLIVPNPNLSLKNNAIAPWSFSGSMIHEQTLRALAKHYSFSLDEKWSVLHAEIKDIILYGSGKEKIEFEFSSASRVHRVERTFEGVIPNLERRYRETASENIREDFVRYQNSRTCKECEGNRLRPEALAVKIADFHISEVTQMSISDALDWVGKVPERLGRQQNEIATSILKEIQDRLGFLVNVGLEYLTLARKAGTLSGGESQRIRLASQIGSGLSGVLYVLDEPSIGLHQRDNKRLLDTLKNLRDQGNSVVVVEHDEEAIREADFVLDMGPGAGVHGGGIVACGTPQMIAADKHSLTGQYLSGVKSIDADRARRPGNGTGIKVIGACGNNLKDIEVEVPLGKFVCVTGVSGSGKSTLVFNTLLKNAHDIRSSYFAKAENCKAVEGMQKVDKVIDINQKPIGRTPRSNPATYVDAFTPIRNWFAEMPESKQRGYQPGRFSFNVRGGRCEACQGDGVKKISMHFLSDVYVLCESCKGKRYNRETLEIEFKGKNIADVLDMTVEEAELFFRALPAVRPKLLALLEVGLGYIKLGQRATTLSGGEAQRVKLSKELAKRSTGNTLYVLDEPTTGLHFHDVSKLLDVLHALVDLGNTVVVIEHNLDVIKTADWIIDMGPEGGDLGGEVVACGIPEDVAQCVNSYTGQFLAKILSQPRIAAE